MDSGDIDLLGIVHNKLYLDGSLPFGFHLRSSFLERCSGAIRYIMKCHGHNELLNYIDNLKYILDCCQKLKICVVSGNGKNIVARPRYSLYWDLYSILPNVYALQDFS